MRFVVPGVAQTESLRSLGLRIGVPRIPLVVLGSDECTGEFLFAAIE